MKTFLTLVAFVVVTGLVSGLSSCGKDDPAGCGATWGIDLEPQINALTDAIGNYNNDPTEANCNAMRNAYLAYLNALRPYADCAALSPADRTQLNTAISEAEDEVETMCIDE